MFRRYPYTGWLVISILLWSVAGYRYYKKSLLVTPTSMVSAIEKDVQNKQAQLQDFLEDEEQINRIFDNALQQKDIDALTDLPFFVYAYRNGTIIFWNDNKVLADCTEKIPEEGTLLYNDRGVFLKKCIRLDSFGKDEQLVILFPIVKKYPLENNYLHSSFVAGEYIPLSTRILSRETRHSYPVHASSGNTLFHVYISDFDEPRWVPDNFMLGIVIAALLVTILWLQLITIYLTRNKSYGAGFLLTVLVVIGLRAFSYWQGLPFNLQNLEIFSPQLYASSAFLPSLGDLLLNALCLLWLVVFIIRHIPNDFLKSCAPNLPLKITLAVAATALLIYCSFNYINVISTVVIDSSISFDVSHFYTISFYTLVGLFIIGIITGSTMLGIYILNKQLAHLIDNKWIKYLLIAGAGLLMISLSDTSSTTDISYLLLGGLMMFVMLLDVPKLRMVADLFSPRMIFWAALVCLFCTAILQYFNYIKEQETRKLFAERILQQRDDVTEYAFRNIAGNIQKDPTIKAFFDRPTRAKREAIDERFDALYLNGQLNKYQSSVYLFDTRGRSLYNNDPLTYKELDKERQAAIPTLYQALYYKEYAQDGHYYLAKIPVSVDVNDSTTRQVGYVFIDLAVKEATGETIYPELLQPGSVIINRNEEGYSYGVYVNGKLITQTNDYNFPVFLRDTIAERYQFKNWRSSSELRYRADDTKTVIVIRYHRMWLETITLFSYLFGMQMLISLLMAAYRTYLAYFLGVRKAKLINLTLRRRIHLSMLGIVFISFIIIGFITIFYFTYQYKQSNTRKQQATLQLVERNVLQYLKDQKAIDSVAAFRQIVNTPKFRYFITEIANTQSIDINLYYASGVLNVTSQENIYDKSLFARIIRPDAYYRLYNLGEQFFMQEERIGRLQYISCYSPLRNENGTTLGYINVPFFSSQKELNYQISGILVALINLYAFVFLISSVLTLFITRWITRTFNVVISRFEKFSLSKNELIEWPYDDEIGLLIREYNKMVRKVEENAKLLAQSEREGAWREMARQVAHEIKNPLTPMKLNIQYLQQALRNKYDNVEELAGKVSESLIEQIDNLSYIASEFSNFAKMPEAKPEKHELNDMIQKTVDLYQNNDLIELIAEGTDERLEVFLDKSQLLRVLSNLLENATQAIPEDRNGIVKIALQKEDGHAIISIADNGSGIDNDVVDKIFQPYFTTKTSGTGLGLAMTKKIIEFWKGAIWFETEEHVGTTFYIKLPLIKEKKA